MAKELGLDLSHLFEKLDRFTADAKKEIAAGLFASGLKIEETAKLSILQGSKTGREYRRRSVVHKASAPSEAPASDTGRLAASIQTTAKDNGMTVEVAAGTGIVDYAVHLEYGTRNMAERPFMRPALKNETDFIYNRMKKAVKRAVAKNADK